jgi:hypothetical protein
MTRLSHRMTPFVLFAGIAIAAPLLAHRAMGPRNEASFRGEPLARLVVSRSHLFIFKEVLFKSTDLELIKGVLDHLDNGTTEYGDLGPDDSTDRIVIDLSTRSLDTQRYTISSGKGLWRVGYPRSPDHIGNTSEGLITREEDSRFLAATFKLSSP